MIGTMWKARPALLLATSLAIAAGGKTLIETVGSSLRPAAEISVPIERVAIPRERDLHGPRHQPTTERRGRASAGLKPVLLKLRARDDQQDAKRPGHPD
jgi:hypothetical protein